MFIGGFLGFLNLSFGFSNVAFLKIKWSGTKNDFLGAVFVEHIKNDMRSNKFTKILHIFDELFVIGGFIYGPGSAFIMSVITSLLEIMYRGGNLLDVLMNVISTCTFACVAAWIYKRDHTREGAFIGLGAGIVCCVLSMLLWNYIVTPIYFGMPREAVVSILIPGILPFNLLKCGLNTGLTLFLYKPIVGVFRRTSLVEHSSGGDHAITKGTVLIGLFICASVICFILGFQGII